jgi:hypothetical protein
MMAERGLVWILTIAPGSTLFANPSQRIRRELRKPTALAVDEPTISHVKQVGVFYRAVDSEDTIDFMLSQPCRRPRNFCSLRCWRTSEVRPVINVDGHRLCRTIGTEEPASWGGTVDAGPALFEQHRPAGPSF